MDWEVTAKPVWEERLSKYRKYLLDTSPFLMAASASVSPPNIWPVMLLGYGFAWKQLSFLFFLTLPALDFWICISTSFIFCTKWHPVWAGCCPSLHTHFPMWCGLLFSLQLVNGFHQWIERRLSPQIAVFSLGWSFCIIRIGIFLFLFAFLFFWFSNQFHLTVIGLVKCLLCSTTYTLLGLFTKNLQSATCASKIKILKTIKPGFVLSLCYFPAWPPKHIAFPYTDSWFKGKIYNKKKSHRIV